MNRVNESQPLATSLHLFLFTGVSCVANGNKSKANIFLYFVLFCARFYLPLDLSLAQTPRAQLFFCVNSKQKTIFILRKSEKFLIFSSSLKYVFYIVCELISWHANRIVNTQKFK